MIHTASLSGSFHRLQLPRLCLAVLIAALAALVAVALGFRLYGQLHLLWAERARNENDLHGAAAHLIRSADFLQGGGAVQQKLGEVCLEIGESRKRPAEMFEWASRAAAHFEAAMRENPLDPQNAYGRARSDSFREKIYPVVFKGKQSPYDPLRYFQEAIRLRPNSTTYRYALSRYLYLWSRTTELAESLRHLARIRPNIVGHLMREPFWNDRARDAVRRGLEDSLGKRRELSAVHTALARLAAEVEHWSEAARHFRRAMDLQAGKPSEQQWTHLGQLKLRAGDAAGAADCFLQGLAVSTNREALLRSIFSFYRGAKQEEAFGKFHVRARRRFSLASDSELLLVQSYLRAGKLAEARKILESAIDAAPTGDAYYWLSLVAEKEQDWNAMELAIQKATVLSPNSERYRKRFIGLLLRLKKYHSAEYQLGVLIDEADSPDAGLYHQRADLRWRLGDFVGAAQDWQSAIGIAPGRAEYYARAAEAYIQTGDWSRAVDCYRRAVALDGENHRYKRRYRELFGKE